MTKTVYIGKNQLYAPPGPVSGQHVILDGEEYYRICNYDQMQPFFMTVVSSSDHWIFISSTGALTAGRSHPDNSLFPYYTDDKIHDSSEITGSKSICIVERSGPNQLWEPFSIRHRGIHRVQRNLYKNICGNKLVFEEVNSDLALTFRYGWFTSERFGFVRRAWLVNTGKSTARVSLLDGIQNLMPCGVGSQFQLEKSTLLDAYKRNELLPASGLGLFRLSSIPIDRPEPAEALRTTLVWSAGLIPRLRLLSSSQLDRFRQGESIRQELDIRAARGAYFIQANLAVKPGQTVEWLMAAEVNCGPSDVAKIELLLRRPAQLQALVLADIGQGTEELRRIVSSADGIQKTARPLGDARHFNNVLFNVMRGGVFADRYWVDTADLRRHVSNANRPVASRNTSFFQFLRRRNHVSRVIAQAAATEDLLLERLCREYLPLTFSRRHGDPSRPWNRFSISTRNADGARILYYEGNWRDIFQNWEALALSFPGFVSSMICRFVNASTADGYNPYRISRDGIDWETVSSNDPWAHIGYWGDHQVIYLIKLIEILERHEPKTLRQFLTRDLFSYANVPYRIRPYGQLLENPKETVDFDRPSEQMIQKRVQMLGTDGKLHLDRNSQVRQVNLTEKLLVSVLAKLANFIPEAGIWMNTQRPEWNDANNALVGFGVSMVTLYYLRRYLSFCQTVFSSLDNPDIRLSQEVNQHLQSTHQILLKHQPLLNRSINDQDRRRMLDALGQAGSHYRQRIYSHGFSGRRVCVAKARLIEFFEIALQWIDHSIRANRRTDGLYHAYNLVKLNRQDALPIRHLDPMLEGQVAVLSSGYLSAEESLDVLAALKRSPVYRSDQHSYLLYPDRQLPRFVDKNVIPSDRIQESALLKKLVADNNHLLVERDAQGKFHFNGSITNARDVAGILNVLSETGYAPWVKQDFALVLDLFESAFDHQSFTGRSGTFFGYEGLGCTYWHMVSKLLLATQESIIRASGSGALQGVVNQLISRYIDIRKGIGDYKAPQVYGAFPMDPYSHTPAHAGARQPGLTGQVKEDILCRFGELGLSVRDGRIHFLPNKLIKNEFLDKPSEFVFYTLSGIRKQILLQACSLAFSYCQVPIIYRLGEENTTTVFLKNGAQKTSRELCLDAKTSRSIFERLNNVTQIVVNFQF